MGRTFTSDGSDSDANSQGSSPRVAPTPGYSLENHDSRSNSPVHNSSQSPPHRSRSNSNSSHHSEASRPSARSHTKSPSNDRNSHSPNLQIDQGSNKSRSRSRSRSGSVRSKSRSHSRSPSGSRKSGSRSPSQKSNRSGSGSRKSGSPAASRHSRSRSRSGSRKSGSPATSRKSISASRSRSGSRSRSHSRSKSRSRSRSSSGSDAENKKKESRKRKVLSSESNASGDENVAKVKKVSAIIDSDSDEEVRGEGDTTPVADASQANELFGDADDITDSDDDNEEKKKSKKIISDDERDRDSDRERDRDSDRRRSTDDERASPYAEEREKSPEPEPIPETKIDVDIPRIATDLGKDMHFVKLPNFLSVETRPFDVETYEDEIDEEETLDEEGRQRLKLKVGNTIRWRNEIDKTGTALHESNARFVKWSDGSMSLHLGNEIFDVYKQPLQGDHNHLFIRQGTGLQGQAVFRTKLTFRPHSTESFTHKKMTMSLADRSQKTSGIKILTQVGHDPDADRYINLKREEEKLRQAMRVKHATKPKRSRDPGASHNLSYRDHDEGSEDEGGISIAAIKNKFKKGGAAAIGKQSASAIYSSDEEDGSDFETRRPKKIDRTKTSKALKDSDDDEDDESVASGGGDKSAEDANDDEEDSD